MVLVPDPPTEFIEDYAFVARHVQQRYRMAGVLGQEPRMQLLVERSRSVVRTHEPRVCPASGSPRWRVCE